MTDTHPIWTEHQPSRFPALSEDLQVDVLIVGGGITGVSCAHILRAMGNRVALVESRTLGAGETSHTTAHLTYMTDTRLSDLIRVCGKEETRMAWMAGKTAMDYIRANAKNIPDVVFREIPGFLATVSDDDVESLRDECGQIREWGFEAEWVDSIFPTGRPGIRFNRQMLFHPMAYLDHLANEAAAAGVRIFENTEVEEFQDSPRAVVAGGRTISYDKVIIATHVPLQGQRGTVSAALFQTKLASYSTYAIAATYPKDSLPGQIWSDTADPFNYLRIHQGKEHDFVILGGEDHKTGEVTDTLRCFASLESKLAGMLPGGKVTHRWSGQVIETVDGLPYIGESSEHEFIATGFSGNGFTFGTTAALMAKDWIDGADNPCAGIFKPGRVHLSAAAAYLDENKDFPYRLLKDRFNVPEIDPEALQADEGCLIRGSNGVEAVCRDSSGKLHRLNATCPHMGCLVLWNDGERTWDCPCHGSRFTAEGKVIAGPAESDLEPMESES